jgi:hypothetical protein
MRKECIYIYLLRRQQRHAHSNPAALARAKNKRLVDTESLHDLQVHGSRVPVRPVRRGVRPRLAMAEEFNGDEVHCVGEGAVGVHVAIEL